MPVVDLHTNGWLLQGPKPKFQLDHLEDAGLSMLTLSVAHDNPEMNRQFMGGHGGCVDPLIRHARDIGLLTRVSLLVHRGGIQNLDDIMRYIQHFGNLGVHMVVIRELWVPAGKEPTAWPSTKHHPWYWSFHNKVPIAPLEAAFDAIAWTEGHLRTELRVERREPLPWGQKVFAVSGFPNKDYGVNVTFARCDEGQNGQIIKSIVHRPDGHGYRNWDSNGDLLY